MTPVLALWPEGLSGKLRSDVDERMAADGFGDDLYRSITCHLAADKLRDTGIMLSAEYTSLIGLDATDTTLHTVLAVPLWHAGAVEAARSLIDAAGSITHAVSVDIIGLQSGLDFDDSPEGAPERREAERKATEAIAAMCAAAPFGCRLSLLDNYNATGASAGFNDRLLAKFVCALLRVMIENFDSTFARLAADAAEPAVVAPGISCLEFRRDRMADYLLSRAFISALDSAGVMQKKVDAQGAAERARACLAGIDRFYSEFYDTHVEPLIAQGLPEGEIAAKVRKPLDEAVNALHKRLTAFMDEAGLTLPEKESTWAIILGRDNEHLEGTLYKQRSLTFDDAFTQPAKLFIDAFNAYAAGEGLLPERRQYPALKIAGSDGDEENPLNKQAFDPLPDIKALKAEMLDITAYMRTKEQELATLRDNNEKRTIAEGHLSEEGFVFHGVQRRLESAIVEEPLQEVYEPAAGLKPQPSVDLRPFFSPVRDQGPVGSCTAFAVTGIYEAIMNRNNASLDGGANMSERYIFYHTNISKGRANEGSSFSDQLNALGRHGICEEALFPYVVEIMNEAPGEAAIADALKHRVTLAKQVPLKSEGSKYDCMRANHLMLTSALSEGYPVGISLKVFDDFGSHPGGHVPRPSDDAVLHAEHGHHAMVLAGYSERDKCYIVRNSWGEGFGDKGYAYISAAYIDDPELCRFACIITETTDGTATGGTATPALVAQFGGTETDIRIAATINALDEARIHFKSLAAVYEELYRYYADLMQRLSQPFVRNELRRRSEQASALRYADMALRKDSLLGGFTDALKSFCRNYIKNSLVVSAVALLMCVAAALMFYYGIDTDFRTYLTVGAGIAVAAATAMWLHYKWARRRKRLELQEEIDAVATSMGREERELLTMQMRFHVGGMVLDALQRLSLSLVADYQRLVSFNNNLCCWYDEDSRRADTLETGSEAMFVNLTDHALLDAFFETHRAEVSGRIDLMKAFGGYDLTPEGMQRVRDGLEAHTRDAITPLFADFSMAEYIMGTRRYPYLPEPQLEAMLKRLNRMATSLTRHRSIDSAYESRHLMACVDATRRQQWLTVCTPHFAFRPMPLDTPDADRLTILTLNLVPATTLVH